MCGRGSRRAESEIGTDHVEHPLGFFEDLAIFEPYNNDPNRLKVFRSFPIPRCSLTGKMPGAVQFNREFLRRTVEVENIISHRMLPDKFTPLKL